MTTLLDTSILGRLANQADTDHATAKRIIADLHRGGEVLHITPQNMVEFRNFATRPKVVNGLGLTSANAAAIAAIFEASFPMLEETPAIHPAWRSLVDLAGVIGKQVHDARLVAVCHVHTVPKLLTFNVSHFQRFAGVSPGIVIMDASTM